MSESISLAGLFLSALLASTLLPGGSEAVLIWLDQHSTTDPVILLITATAGNTIGGLSTFWIGWLVSKRWSQSELSKKSHPKSTAWIERYGAPVLLLSWLPLVGDALCLAAGWFRLSLLPALLFITVGKALRYGVLLWII